MVPPEITPPASLEIAPRMVQPEIAPPEFASRMVPPQGGRRCWASISSLLDGHACSLLPQATPPSSPLAGGRCSPPASMGPPRGGRRRRASISSLPGGRACSLLPQATPPSSLLAAGRRSPPAPMRPPRGGRHRRATFSSHPIAIPPACTLQPSPAVFLLDEKAWTQGRSLSPHLPEPSLAIVRVDEAEQDEAEQQLEHPGFCNTLQCMLFYVRHGLFP
jgi:hypothetical protein